MPNATLAYQVLDLINANRAHFNMGMWVQRENDNDSSLVGLAELTAEENTCGTAACFAGWAVAAAGYRVDAATEAIYDQGGWKVHHDVCEFATELLDIDPDTADGLFYVGDDKIGDAVAETFGPRP
jgi:hypothetical protein